nr:MAG TPA: hypothetical protein [Caudoviricetes sp.]
MYCNLSTPDYSVYKSYKITPRLKQGKHYEFYYQVCGYQRPEYLVTFSYWLN